MMKSQEENSKMENMSAEETLRLIASLPAPDGLVERVQTRLQTVRRTGRILNWPQGLVSSGRRYGNAMRGAAAAAIVCVVVGGGWRIYSRVQPAPSARVIVMPVPAASSRGFSIGGSVHTPDPHIGPVLTPQLFAQPSRIESVQPIAIQPKRVAKPGNPGSASNSVGNQTINSPK
jgi:hypothetical protein